MDNASRITHRNEVDNVSRITHRNEVDNVSRITRRNEVKSIHGLPRNFLGVCVILKNIFFYDLYMDVNRRTLAESQDFRMTCIMR